MSILTHLKVIGYCPKMWSLGEYQHELINQVSLILSTISIPSLYLSLSLHIPLQLISNSLLFAQLLLIQLRFLQKRGLFLFQYQNLHLKCVKMKMREGCLVNIHEKVINPRGFNKKAENEKGTTYSFDIILFFKI